MDGSMNHKYAATWESQGLREFASQTPFKGATQHWQDKALSFFIEEGYPGRHVEAWRYTDLTSLLAQSFSSTHATPPNVSAIDLSNYKVEDSYRLVFIDGAYCLEQSTVPESVSVLAIAELLAMEDETILREFRIELDPPYFACLNSALMRQGCYIKIKPNSILDKPLHILHVATHALPSAMYHPRFFIDADKNSEITLLEEHVGPGQSIYFNNVVTQINLNFDSRVTYFKFQRESEQAYHFATTIASLSAHSQLHYYMIADGALLNRDEVFIRHYERGSQANLVGFYNAKAQRQTFQHARVDHFKRQCSTYQSYKGMARDESKAVFDSKMVVHPGANQCSVHQSNHNLLLSKDAEIDTKPNLEVYTDDITASHGATVGQLDEMALFYLQSRGIDAQQARHMLMSGFVNSIFEEMPNNTVTAYLRREFLGEFKDG